MSAPAILHVVVAVMVIARLAISLLTMAVTNHRMVEEYRPHPRAMFDSILQAAMLLALLATGYWR